MQLVDLLRALSANSGSEMMAAKLPAAWLSHQVNRHFTAAAAGAWVPPAVLQDDWNLEVLGALAANGERQRAGPGHARGAGRR